MVEHVARQVKASAAELGFYEWSGRTMGRHRGEIREHLGFRECSVADAEKLTDWLAANVAHAERDADKVRVELLKRMREERIEPSTDGRVGRMVASALRTAELTWFAAVPARLDAAAAVRVLALVGWGEDAPQAEDEAEDPESVLALIKSMPGNVSLESMPTEIRKLRAARGIGLPVRLFADVAPKVLASWRARAAVESPSHLRRRSADSAVTLLAALVHERRREITDDLTELLIATVHRIDARAHRKVTDELVNAFKRVDGKESLLFKIAEAALAEPGGTVRQVVYPAVRGREQTLKELVHEFRTKGPVYRQTVQRTLKASYTNHYRRGMIDLLEVLEFRSTRRDHPLLAALEVIKRHAKAGNATYYPLGEVAPRHKGIDEDWAALVYRADRRGKQRTVRMAYEVATFRALREMLRCKEIWVVGAGRYRNPDEDLPKDFEARRVDYYTELRKPLDPAVFTESLHGEMTAALEELNDALPDLDWVDISERRQGAIRLTPLDAAPEPRNLRRIKNEVSRRWQAVPLIDILKEALLRTGILDQVASVAGGGSLKPEILAERLMLAIYGYGTNTGIRAVLPAGGAHSEEEVRYVRRRYLTAPVAQAIAVGIANATFAARDAGLWGNASTAVASDSTHFRSWDQNLFTEWHARYGGGGILVYWHVEDKYVVVHSQVLKASASEVAAMVEGAVRHGTSMNLAGNYVDSHGQSEIGFGVTRLLDFDLLPRIKRINTVRMYRPEPAGAPDRFAPGPSPAPPDPLETDRGELRPGGQVRHRDQERHRVHRGGPFPLHRRRVPSRLPGHAGDRQGTAHPLCRPLPVRPEPPAADRAGPERGGVLEPGQLGDLLRQERGDLHQPPGRGRDDRAVPADPASLPRLRQHSHAPRRPRRGAVVRPAHPGRAARPQPPVLAACSPLRRGHSRPRPPPDHRHASLVLTTPTSPATRPGVLGALLVPPRRGRPATGNARRGGPRGGSARLDG